VAARLITEMAAHIVKQGEYLAKIARQYGFGDFRTIWDHPENAELRAKRPSPNVLFPGDRVHIPDKREKQEPGATQEKHRFQVLVQKLLLRIALRDADRQPMANTPCELQIEGEIFTLTSDANGLIEHSIPKTAESGLLVIRDVMGGLDPGAPLKIGHLDPIEEVTGQVARLNNLGYDAGPLDTIDESRVVSAVEEFQCDEGLSVTGRCDQETQAKLRAVYGC
jgi:N-acetylmuramoyl-L-alanine amidase